MEKAADKLASLSLQQKAKLPAKLPPGTSGTGVTVVTNLRAITLDKNQSIFKYDVNIRYIYTGKNGEEKVIEVSKSTRKGAEKDRDIQMCIESYKKAIRNPQFKKGRFFYDRQASLYTLDLIKGAEQGLVIDMDGSGSFEKASLTKIIVKFTAVKDSFQTSSNDVKNTYNECPKEADTTLHEALNCIISATANDNDNVVTLGACTHYFINPSMAGFDDIVKFENGKKSSSVGVSKAVKTLEGFGTEASLFVVTEPKITLFHDDDTPLYDKLKGLGKLMDNMTGAQAQHLLKLVKGLQCYTTYGKNGGGAKRGRIYTIKEFGPSASAQKFDAGNGKVVTMTVYFDKTYGIRLQYPNLFTIKVNQRDCYIPVELLCVCAAQPVRNEQMGHGEQEKMIRHSALKPDQRVRTTQLAATEAGLVPNQPIAGAITVSRDCVEVGGRRLPAPKIKFDKLVTVAEDKGKPGVWSKATTGKFFKPASINNWQFLIIEENLGRDYVQVIVNKARYFGMRVAEPEVKIYSQYNGYMRGMFEDAKQAGVQFMFFVIRDSLHLHQQMKTLEQEYQICTQEVRGTTAKKNQPQTLENIVNKMNIKNGGLTCEVGAITNDPTRLFIGLETAQRNSGAGLLVVSVGYSANTLAHPQEYVGGYLFVQKDRENNDVYKTVIRQVVSRSIANAFKSRKVLPKHIVIYFNGISDGQYDLAASEYLNEVKAGCMEHKIQPILTGLAVNKTHNERLVLKTPRGVVNPAPGTVIDSKIVSKVYNEFYLTGANAFQGTSKTPKYALVFATGKCPMDKLEEMSFELCHLHGIVQSTVSLPAPLVIADRYSKRGACVLANRGLSQEEMMDVATINSKYTYEGRELEGRRFNA